jgi:mRNA-degrading endonuclease toxin of MazEF toxin-antitoxin module
MFSTLLGASCLILAATSAFAQSARARIAQTPVRAEASVTSATVATLNAGDPIDVVEANGSWYRVLVPGTQETPLVGYVQAQQVDIVDADAPAEPHETTPAAVVRKAQGPQIPPTALELQQRELRAKAAAREEALKSEVDAAQARLDALKSGEPTAPQEANQVPPPAAHRSPQRTAPGSTPTSASGWPAAHLRGRLGQRIQRRVVSRQGHQRPHPARRRHGRSCSDREPPRTPARSWTRACASIRSARRGSS